MPKAMYLAVFLFSIAAESRTIEQEIKYQAAKQGLNPNLALAVAKVESSLNPKAIGADGEVGLFQLHPAYTKAKIHDVKTNIKEGVRQLIYWRDKCPVRAGYTWVTCFNQGARKPRHPHLLPYYKKVMAAMR